MTGKERREEKAANEAARRLPRTIVARVIDGIEYQLNQTWGHRKALRAKLQDKDDDEATPVLEAALDECLVGVKGLKDSDGQPMEWDGDLMVLAGEHLEQLMFSFIMPVLPEGVMEALPTLSKSQPQRAGR